VPIASAAGTGAAIGERADPPTARGRRPESNRWKATTNGHLLALRTDAMEPGEDVPATELPGIRAAVGR
jgi:hypothetical protein